MRDDIIKVVVSVLLLDPFKPTCRHLHLSLLMVPKDVVIKVKATRLTLYKLGNFAKLDLTTLF